MHFIILCSQTGQLLYLENICDGKENISHSRMRMQLTHHQYLALTGILKQGFFLSFHWSHFFGHYLSHKITVLESLCKIRCWLSVRCWVVDHAWLRHVWLLLLLYMMEFRLLLLLLLLLWCHARWCANRMRCSQAHTLGIRAVIVVMIALVPLASLITLVKW